jgi:hypothetical protein
MSAPLVAGLFITIGPLATADEVVVLAGADVAALLAVLPVTMNLPIIPASLCPASKQL